MKRREFLKLIGAAPIAAATISLKGTGVLRTKDVAFPINYVEQPSLLVGLFDSAGKEASYTGYTRVAVERSANAWLVEDGRVSNAAEILFPKVTSEPCAITSFGIFTPDGIKVCEGELEVDVPIFSGDSVLFKENSLSIAFEDVAFEDVLEDPEELE